MARRPYKSPLRRRRDRPAGAGMAPPPPAPMGLGLVPGQPAPAYGSPLGLSGPALGVGQGVNPAATRQGGPAWSDLALGAGIGLLTGDNWGEGVGQGLLYAKQFGDQRTDRERQARLDQQNTEKFQFEKDKAQREADAALKAAEGYQMFLGRISDDDPSNDVPGLTREHGMFMSGLTPEQGYSFAEQHAFPKAAEQPGNVREYEYAKSQGYQGSFLDFQLEQKKAGASTTKLDVHAPTQPMIGTIPPGYVAIPDGNGMYRYEKIPGGPAAEEAAAAAEKAAAGTATRTQTADIVSEEILRALELGKSATLPTSGAAGGVLSNVPGSAAYDTSKLLDTVKANIGFDRLQQMRDESPTGGALGAINNQEMNLLQSVKGSLDQSQGTPQFEYNLKRLYNIHQDIIHGKGNGPRLPLEAEPAGGATVIDGYTITPVP